ncbi:MULTISPECIES: flagellar basal body-associated protein FliL [Pseudoalteromonas]|jgi:flagellar FliL protein|uniref:Flagellar protein FliL n=3 Tax=Pseudoalteromonas TaxID=53246 RepID=A0AA37W4P5_9GAMM|nr:MULTISPECIES: flagellar basal body-associated protein FliL [Pseudoalteromonas]MBL0688205.1 flagellar basal body-associated protein FliL [Pseudoalteromonas sp.]OLF72926.1 flagellar basal body-associated protein FliL [Pseudoalteromonas haloplanktis]ATD02385.1 flagellar FliL protein [Pseudoalteromonas tetraodonis]KAF7767161.1 flagellar FliL protein [Pseudoalteromonas undina]KGJ98818.1 flagellar basal body-associated protein FliL [Pseudoalteromonas sp. ND6B]|tara:strand:- start:81 stop:479 length:399 start_codon:yes stop_codon:yes gene_type:complete
MKKTVFTGLFILLVSLTSLSARAESTVGYFGFEPDIITNYIGPSSKKMGYVRVTVDLMLNKTSDIAIVEHHTPLLRDALVEILSKEPENKIKSLTGREQIRLKSAEKLKSLLKEETGQEIIRDLLFTKYLYH